MKSTVEEIRERFDNDVERFSNIQTGQSATIDAPLVLDLIVDVASGINESASDLLDIGCGAGNYSVKFLHSIAGLNCHLVDLSMPMLERAQQRCLSSGASSVTSIQGDIRDIDLGAESFDIVVSGAALHHLRSNDEWRNVFEKIYRSLRPGGSFWVADLIVHDAPAIQEVMWRRYGDYLTGLENEAYRDHVFNYIEKEDTPKSMLFQLELMRRVGFSEVEVLHKNSCFAAFGAIK